MRNPWIGLLLTACASPMAGPTARDLDERAALDSADTGASCGDTAGGGTCLPVPAAGHVTAWAASLTEALADPLHCWSVTWRSQSLSVGPQGIVILVTGIHTGAVAEAAVLSGSGGAAVTRGLVKEGNTLVWEGGSGGYPRRIYKADLATGTWGQSVGTRQPAVLTRVQGNWYEKVVEGEDHPFLFYRDARALLRRAPDRVDMFGLGGSLVLGNDRQSLLGTWFAGDSVEIIHPFTLRTTRNITLSDFDEYILGVDGIGDELVVLSDASGDYGHLGHRLAVFDRATGQNTGNVFYLPGFQLPSVVDVYPFGVVCERL